VRSAAEKANDLLLVAGLNVAQRRKLRAAGFTTVGDLAAAGAAPDGMAPTTFEKLKAQARLQWTQMQAGPEAPMTAELTPSAARTLALLPAPSEGDPSRSGLEYLWGIMDAAERFEFAPHWAHTWKDERAAFVAFIEFIAARRAQYPDMHIYHYAPYETTALKRMMMTYQVKQDELDTLLREEVFVDLYATVRGAIRISAPSYSIKKLEPLYMGDQLRNEDGVTSGGASIVAYQQYRELREAGGLDAALEPIRSALRTPEAADRIAMHLARAIERAVKSIAEGERTVAGLDLARRLIDLIRELPSAADFGAERAVAAGDRPGDHTAPNRSAAAAPSPSPCHSNTPHSTHTPAPTSETQDDPDTESDAPECSEPPRAALSRFCDAHRSS
jgi:predicted RecB family nuclease